MSQCRDQRCDVLRLAEALPFDDQSFDGAISTYGVSFSQDPSSAVSEMARVLRSGGRLALSTWADDPEGYIARFFALIGERSDAPPPAASPFNWGRSDWLNETSGEKFEIDVRELVTTFHAPDVATVWEEYVKGFGPVAATYAALPQCRRDAFKTAFQTFHHPFECGQGLTIPRQAFVVRGVRG